MKKICKFLTFLLVLAMLLSTVAMAEDTSYTITAGTFSNGTVTIKYTKENSNQHQEVLTSGTSTQTAVKSGTEITVEFEPSAGYEFGSATYKVGDNGTETPINDGSKITLTGNTTITPVFQAKSTLGGEKTADSFQLRAICSGS